MANATTHTVKEIILKLTEKEAQALRTVCGSVGGYPTEQRGEMDNISNALSAIGFEAKPFDIEGSVYFKE